jgi:hypothetical protein
MIPLWQYIPNLQKALPFKGCEAGAPYKTGELSAVHSTVSRRGWEMSCLDMSSIIVSVPNLNFDLVVPLRHVFDILKLLFGEEFAENVILELVETTREGEESIAAKIEVSGAEKCHVVNADAQRKLFLHHLPDQRHSSARQITVCFEEWSKRLRTTNFHGGRKCLHQTSILRRKRKSDVWDRDRLVWEKIRGQIQSEAVPTLAFDLESDRTSTSGFVLRDFPKIGTFRKHFLEATQIPIAEREETCRASRIYLAMSHLNLFAVSFCSNKIFGTWNNDVAPLIANPDHGNAFNILYLMQRLVVRRDGIRRYFYLHRSLETCRKRERERCDTSW